MSTNKIYGKGSIIKLDDFGILRDYKITKVESNGDFRLEFPGTIGFTCSLKWIKENEINT